MKMVKCILEFEYFTVFLKNRNFISKIRISKVAYYAALNQSAQLQRLARILDFACHKFRKRITKALSC